MEVHVSPGICPRGGGLFLLLVHRERLTAARRHGRSPATSTSSTTETNANRINAIFSV